MGTCGVPSTACRGLCVGKRQGKVSGSMMCPAQRVKGVHEGQGKSFVRSSVSECIGV